MFRFGPFQWAKNGPFWCTIFGPFRRTLIVRNYLPSNYTNRFWIAGVLSCRPIFLEKQFSNWCCFSYHFFFCIFQCQDLLLCTYVKTVSNSFSKETHLATNQHPFAWMQFSNHITTRNYHLSFRIDTYSAFQRSFWFTPVKSGMHLSAIAFRDWPIFQL